MKRGELFLNGAEEIKLCINVRYANGAIPIENAVIAVGETGEKEIYYTDLEGSVCFGLDPSYTEMRLSVSKNGFFERVLFFSGGRIGDIYYINVNLFPIYDDIEGEGEL